MRMETTIYNNDRKKPITTLDTALMPPVGARVGIDGRHGYVVSEPPEIYIEKAADSSDDKVSIYVIVTEG